MIAICTAFDRTLIAIDIDGKKGDNILPAHRQSENLLFEVEALLEKLGTPLERNNAFAVVVGPGSFTGLRIGCAIVKGLCAGQENEKPVVALSSFDAIAYEYIKQNKKAGRFVCAINALSGLVYICEYDGQKQVGAPCVISREQFDGLKIAKVGIAGEGIAEVEVCLTTQGLLSLANAALLEGKGTDAQSLAPVYIRKSQAEDDLDKKIAKKS